MLYERINKLIHGVTLGLPVASFSIFYLDKLYSGAESQRIVAIGSTYFMVWFACIAYAWLRNNTYQLVRQLFGLMALMLLGLPLLNFGLVRHSLIDGLIAGASWAWVDVSMLLSGLMLFFISRYLPKTRRLNPRERASANPTNSIAS